MKKVKVIISLQVLFLAGILVFSAGIAYNGAGQATTPVIADTATNLAIQNKGYQLRSPEEYEKYQDEHLGSLVGMEQAIRVLEEGSIPDDAELINIPGAKDLYLVPIAIGIGEKIIDGEKVEVEESILVAMSRNQQPPEVTAIIPEHSIADTLGIGFIGLPPPINITKSSSAGSAEFQEWLEGLKLFDADSGIKEVVLDGERYSVETQLDDNDKMIVIVKVPKDIDISNIRLMPAESPSLSLIGPSPIIDRIDRDEVREVTFKLSPGPYLFAPVVDPTTTKSSSAGYITIGPLGFELADALEFKANETLYKQAMSMVENYVSSMVGNYPAVAVAGIMAEPAESPTLVAMLEQSNDGRQFLVLANVIDNEVIRENTLLLIDARSEGIINIFPVTSVEPLDRDMVLPTKSVVPSYIPYQIFVAHGEFQDATKLLDGAIANANHSDLQRYDEAIESLYKAKGKFIEIAYEIEKFVTTASLNENQLMAGIKVSNMERYDGILRAYNEYNNRYNEIEQIIDSYSIDAKDVALLREEVEEARTELIEELFRLSIEEVEAKAIPIKSSSAGLSVVHQNALNLLMPGTVNLDLDILQDISSKLADAIVGYSRQDAQPGMLKDEKSEIQDNLRDVKITKDIVDSVIGLASQHSALRTTFLGEPAQTQKQRFNIILDKDSIPVQQFPAGLLEALEELSVCNIKIADVRSLPTGLRNDNSIIITSTPDGFRDALTHAGMSAKLLHLYNPIEEGHYVPIVQLIGHVQDLLLVSRDDLDLGTRSSLQSRILSSYSFLTKDTLSREDLLGYIKNPANFLIILAPDIIPVIDEVKLRELYNMIIQTSRAA